MRRQERLCEERRAALVDGCRAHLHRGGGADVRADDNPVDAVERERCDLLRPGAGEVEPCRARLPRRLPRRRSRDRPVDDVEAVLAQLALDPRHRGRRDRVQVGVERRVAHRASGPPHVVSDLRSSFRRDDRQHDVRLGDHGGEVVQELERGPGDQTAGPLAAAGERRDDPRSATGKGVPHRATHRSRADDGDGRHGSRGRQLRVTWAATASHRPSRRSQTSV
jgi:hypothetical protein